MVHKRAAYSAFKSVLVGNVEFDGFQADCPESHPFRESHSLGSEMLCSHVGGKNHLFAHANKV